MNLQTTTAVTKWMERLFDTLLVSNVTSTSSNEHVYCLTIPNICLVFSVGVGAGVLVTNYYFQRQSRVQAAAVHHRGSVTKVFKKSNDNQNDDGIQTEYRVLKGAINLLSHKFGIDDKQQSHGFNDDHNYIENEHESEDDECKPHGKVVNYLSPQEMLETLFQENQSESQTNLSNTPSTSTTKVDSLNLNQSLEGQSNKDQRMIHLLYQIQKYSVDTNHPYFFNQLFGALDPVALAAELVALSVNTSSYTYETAPVFTLLERNTIDKLGNLVFDTGCGGGDDDSSQGIDHPTYNATTNDGEKVSMKYDGLMLPGGSLSNLTALHVARYLCKLGIQQQQQQQQAEKEKKESIQVKDRIHQTMMTFEEEKKDQIDYTSPEQLQNYYLNASSKKKANPTLVAFVSSEAHYSFSKAAAVTGIGAENLIKVPTLSNGQMDTGELDRMMREIEQEEDGDEGGDGERIPFFVAATSGSTVRGSFDDIEAIVRVCRKYENRLQQQQQSNTNNNDDSQTTGMPSSPKIWIHVDGAWGGSSIFSSRQDMRHLMKGLSDVDSFTFNPHKMLGAPQQTTAFITRHRGILKASNSAKAKYLFDNRKYGAKYDLGDGSYTCGRRTDAIKLWALWKYYGTKGLAQKVEYKVDVTSKFAKAVQQHECFMLACEPWPFNINFFYLPKRIRKRLDEYGIDRNCINPNVPDEIASDLGDISVKLKLRLHRNGEMIIPFQPLSNQRADCFRFVLSGDKPFSEADIKNVLNLLEKYGSDL